MSSPKKRLRNHLRPLRVRQSRAVIFAATERAQVLLQAGTPHDLAVDEISRLVASEELAEALVDFVENERTVRPIQGTKESVVGYYLFVFSLLSIAVVWKLCRILSIWVIASPSEIPAGMAAAIAQVILIRFAWHVFKAACIALTDALNLATYPTALHRPSATGPELDAIRRERLRLLIAEMVIRLGKREKVSHLYRELTEIELTRPAAVWLLVQAWFGLLIKANLPPFSTRAQAYVLAAAALTASLFAVYLVRSRIHGDAQLAYMGVWAAALCLELLKRPRKIAELEADIPS